MNFTFSLEDIRMPSVIPSLKLVSRYRDMS